MTLRKIFIASTCVFVSSVSAQSADVPLPVAPESVDYVRVCDAFGTGFFYIPGTETCLRLRGRVRAEYRLNNFGTPTSIPQAYGALRNNWSHRAEDATSSMARGYVYFDARTNTEFGLVRAFTEIKVTAESDDAGDTSVSLGKAYVQFGGLTVGRAGSFFDFYTGNTFGTLGQQWSDNGDSWVAAYTAGFGSGVSATLSIEDGSYRRQGLEVAGAANYAAPRSVNYAGNRWPDLVGQLRIDQGWGSAQLMGALHEVRFADASARGVIGWAVGAGATLNMSSILEGANLTLQGVFSDGALKYTSVNLPSIAYDAVYNPANDKTYTGQAWSLSGGAYLPWTNTVSTSLDASFVNVDEKIGFTKYSLQRWNVGGNLVWEPVTGLQLGSELEYRSTNVNREDLITSYDEMVATFRVQRSF